jgi:hypothetical protein
VSYSSIEALCLQNETGVELCVVVVPAASLRLVCLV